MALPLAVRKVFGHALHAAQLGERHEAAKVMHGFGDAGVLEVVENDTGGTVPRRLHSSIGGRGIRPALLPEEEQDWYRHSKGGDGNHTCSA